MIVQPVAVMLMLYGMPITDGEIVPSDTYAQQTETIITTPPSSPSTDDVIITVPDLNLTVQPSDIAQENHPADAHSSQNEIVVSGDTRASRADPLQEVNQASYQAVQAVDQAFVGPVAKGYERAIPEPVRDGVRNALRNLSEPVNFLNFVLQLKIGKAFETVGRFAINSTIGVAGLFDVAKKKSINLPYRRNGFANTMGFYGIKPGPYFYLPLLGPTTLRDLFGNSLDIMLLPNVVGAPFNRSAYAIPTNVVMQLNARVERDAEIQRLQKESPNPYAESRTLYLEMRQAEIDALKAKRKPSPPEPVAANVPATEALVIPNVVPTLDADVASDIPHIADTPPSENPEN
jgi:phospholipid-binding lipoprotein MlaA